MLSRMSLVEQWDSLVAGLDENWVDARIRLALPDVDSARRAASLLGSLGPSRSGQVLSFYAVRKGGGSTPQTVRRGLARLDAEWLDGQLVLAASSAADQVVPAPGTTAPADGEPTLAEAWDRLTETLPPDWSDLYVELALGSSDFVARASLRMTPLNARRDARRASVLRFRCARTYGYGGSPQMTRRCLARCDEDGIRGDLRLLRVLSDTLPVGTQGPVWQIEGRTV